MVEKDILAVSAESVSKAVTQLTLRGAHPTLGNVGPFLSAEAGRG